MLWKLKELVFLRKYTAFYRKNEKLQQQIKDDVINETEALHTEDSTEKQTKDSNSKDRNVNDTKFYFTDMKKKKSSDTNTSEENEALQSKSLNKDRQTLNELYLQDQEVTPFKQANSEVFGKEAIYENKLESSAVLLESHPSFIGDDTKHKNETENLDSPNDVLAQTDAEDINHEEQLRSDNLVSSGDTLTNDTILRNNKNHALINHNFPKEDVGADLTETKDSEKFVTITSEENGTTITTRATPEPTNGELVFSDNTLVKGPLHGNNKSHNSDTKTSEQNKDFQSTNSIKDRQAINKIDLQDQDVTLLQLAASTDEESICEKKLDSSMSLSDFSPLFFGDKTERKNKTENLASPSEVSAQTEYQEINHEDKLQSNGIVLGDKAPTNDTVFGNNKDHTLINHTVPKEDVGADLTGTKNNEEFVTITSEENEIIITSRAIPEARNMIKNSGLVFSDNTLVKDPLYGDNKSDTKTSEKNKDFQALNKIDLQGQDVTLLELEVPIDEDPTCEKVDSSASLSEFSPLFIGHNTQRKNETENLDSPKKVPAQTEYQEINHEDKLQSDAIVFGDKAPTNETFLGNNKYRTLINENIPKEDVGADSTGTEDNEEFVSVTSEENGTTITTRAMSEPTSMTENGVFIFGDNNLVQDPILGDNKNQNVPNQFIKKEDLGADLTETRDMEESVTIRNKEKGTTITIRAITESTNLGKQTKQSNMKYDDYIIIKDTGKPNNSTRVTNDVLENVPRNISTEVLTTTSKNMAAESIKNDSPIKSSTDNVSLSLEQNPNLMNEDHHDVLSRSKNPDKQNQDTKNVNSSDDRSQQDEIEDIYDIVEITELATQKLDEDSKNVAEITSKNDKAEHSLPSSEENTSEVQTFLESLDTDPYNIIDISEIISPSVKPETKET